MTKCAETSAHSAITEARGRRAALLAALLASCTATPALAQAVGSLDNPGFETGDTTGWTTCGGKWYSGTWPVPESECNGPATLATLVGPGTDPITGEQTVFAGNYALRLNNSSGGNDITGLSQSVTNYTGNKLYYAWNAVLEPSHGETDSPSFIIKVIDETTNTVVTNIAYSAYTAQNSTIFRPAGYFVTTDWKVEDIDTTSGHDYKLVFMAVDCYWGGHAGYVYVDGFGNAIPVANANVNFDPSTGVVKGSTILIPIGGTPDIDTAKAFYTTTELGANQVNPNFVGGTLKVDTAGPIATNFTIQSQGGSIDTDGNSIAFTGQFSGSGGMTKLGLGTLTFGGINTIDGPVVVNAGTLKVNAALSTIGVTVNNGGTLSGVGPVIGNISVASGGTLAPGDTIGTLSVGAGNVTLASGSNFAIDIDGRNYVATGGAGTYDRLAMSIGSAFTAGGTLRPVLRGITGGNNNFTPVLGDRFTIVTADAVSGQFASVAQPASGMGTNQRFDVLYNTKNVQLVVTPGSFATLGSASGWKLNGIAAAAGLDPVRPAAGTRSGNLQSLFNGLYGMDAAQYGAAFQQMSGEMHAHNMLLANTTARDTTQSVLDAAALGIGDCASDTDRRASGEQRQDSCDDGRNRPAIWTRLAAQHLKVGDTPASEGFKGNRYGFVAGIHVLNKPGIRLGVGGGYAETDANSVAGSASKLSEGSLFVYGAKEVGPLRIGAMLGWSTTETRTDRAMALLSGNSVARSSYNMETVYGSLEARMTLPVGSGGTIQPVAGVAFANTSADAVQESAPDVNTALALAKGEWNTAHTKLGAEANFRIKGKVDAGVFGNWLHRLSGDSAALRGVGLGNAVWTVQSDGTSDDAFEYGAALTAKVSPAATVRLEYRGLRDGDLSSDRASLGVAVAF